MGKDCDYEKIFDDVLSEALNDYIEEESDDEESQAYIDVLSAFTGDKQLRYLIVNTMTSNN